MAEKFLSTPIIIRSLKIDYGIEVAALEFLPLGADMNATTYKAQTDDYNDYFVKIKRSYKQDISCVIVSLLHEFGIQQVVLPRKTLDGKPVLHIDDLILIVYPFIEGQNGFNRDLTKDQWITLGKALRQIHQIKVPSSIQKQIRREEYADMRRKAVISLFTRIENGSYQGEIELKLLEFIKENKKAINQVVDRAEQLSQTIKNQPSEYVLCHSDIHAGNVLIDSKNAIYIVDWDDPMMAPRERDLMFIGGGVGNVWNKPHEEEFFYQGYGNITVNKSILAYYRCERIVEDIAEMLLDPISDTDKPSVYKMFTSMFEYNGVVDIALKAV